MGARIGGDHAPPRDPPGPGARARRGPRPALGPGRGDARRGPVPRRPDRQRLRARAGEQRASSRRSSTSSATPPPGPPATSHPVSIGSARAGRRAILPPFEMALRAGARSVMNSYTDIDGVPVGRRRRACSPRCCATTSGSTGPSRPTTSPSPSSQTLHRVAASPGEAAGLALAAGIDVELPSINAFGEPLLAAVADGTVDEKLVDRALTGCCARSASSACSTRAGRPPSRTTSTSTTPSPGRWPSSSRGVPWCSWRTTAPCRCAAGARLAVVGPRADTPRRCSAATPSRCTCSCTTPTSSPVWRSAPSAKRWPTTFDVTYALGCPVLGGSDDDIEAAAAAAAAADVCVVVLGDQAGLFGNGTSGEGYDVADLRLPGRQEELLEALLGDRHARRRCPAGRTPLRPEPPGRPARRARVRLLPGRGGRAGDRRRARAAG